MLTAGCVVLVLIVYVNLHAVSFRELTHYNTLQDFHPLAKIGTSLIWILIRLRKRCAELCYNLCLYVCVDSVELISNCGKLYLPDSLWTGLDTRKLLSQFSDLLDRM